MRDTDNPDPLVPEQTSTGVWPYVGVGCMTAVIGFFGTAMISVLVAKLVGVATGCTADAETGAPCNWLTWAVRGGILGMICLPSFLIWRMRQSRTAHTNSE
jgi:hypothetical protein